MDSHNPQQRDYLSPPASRQDAIHSASSSPSSPHAPAYTDPPATFQTDHRAAGASADTVGEGIPLAPPDATEDGVDAVGIDDDDGPITVPVLGIQPLAFNSSSGQVHQRDQVVQDDHDPWSGADSDAGDDTDDANNHAGARTSNDDEDNTGDALDALDPDITLGFGGEPLLRDDAFAFRERSWDSWKRTRRTALTMLALTAMVVVAILGATFAASYMQYATRGLSIAPSQPTVSSFSGGLVIQGPETIAPTPEAPHFQIGAWMSNNAPGGGSVKVFVRLTENVKPLAHVSVRLAAQVPGGVLHFGPTKTNAYGLATFTVRYGGLRGTPVFVTATAKVGGQTLTADTVFVPI